ncbi:MAG: hypothetical protein WC820_07670 [Spirochaetales bacterium]|jgi:hypothetical protein
MFVEISVTLLIVCFISCLYLLVCRKKVLKELKKKSGTATKIKWTPWVETMGEEWHETRFEVFYKDPDGNPHTAICRTRLFSEVYWHDGG